jgi:hypothetical protein
VDGVQRLIGQDGVIDLVFILSAERRLLQEHLVDENSECPPIHSAAVLLVKEDLAKSISSRSLVHGVKLTSGAMNSGVPQNVLVVEPYHISSLHKP